MKSLREKIIEYGTFLMVLITPILYLGNTWFVPHVSPKTFFFYGIVEIIFFLWIYSVIVDKTYRIDKKTLLFFIPVILYVLWMTVAGLVGVRPEMSFWSSLVRATGLLTLYHFLAFLFVFISLLRRKNFYLYGKMFLFYFLSGAFLLTLSVWLGNEGFNVPVNFLQNTNGGGLVGNSSVTASYLMFSFFLGLFLLFKKDFLNKQKIWIGFNISFILFSPLFINIYGFFTGNSILGSARGALLGIILGFITMCFVYLALSKNKIIKILGLSSILLFMVLFCIGWSQLMKPNTIIHNKFTEVATDSRFIFWNISSKAINDRPILGWGPENYSVVYQKYFDPHIYLQPNSVEVYNDRAHNIFFDIGVSGGYPAILFYILFLLSIFYTIHRAYILGNFSRLQVGILHGLLVGYIFQNLFVFDSLLSMLGLFILTGITFASTNQIIDKSINKNNDFRVKEFHKVSILIIISILLILSLLFFVIKPSKKIIRLSSVTNMLLDKRADHYNDLLNISPIGDGWEVGDIANNAYITYVKNKNQIISNPKILTYVEKDIEKLNKYLEIVSKKEIYDYRLYLNMARLYNLQISLTGKSNDILFNKHLLEIEYHLQKLSPNDPGVDWELAQTLMFIGNNKSAEQALLLAVSLAPYVKGSHQMLINFYKHTKNIDAFNKALLNAKENISDFSYID